MQNMSSIEDDFSDIQSTGEYGEESVGSGSLKSQSKRILNHSNACDPPKNS